MTRNVTLMFAHVVVRSIDLMTVLALQRLNVAGATPKNTACLRVLTSLLGLDVSSKLDLLRRHVLQFLSATNKEDHRSVTHPIVAPPDTGNLSMVNTIDSTVEDPDSDSDSVMSVQNYEETRKRKTQPKSDEVSVSSKLLSQSKAQCKAFCESGLGYNPNPG